MGRGGLKAMNAAFRRERRARLLAELRAGVLLDVAVLTGAAAAAALVLGSLVFS